MGENEKRLYSCFDYVKKRLDFFPKVALVLGSGLSGIADGYEKVSEIAYSEIPGFPISTVKGHSGKFLFARVSDVPVAVMCGRVHLYEGYKPFDTVLPLRILGLLGAKTAILTNAAGAVNKDFSVGELMLIKDHISSFVPSPLTGENIASLGTRFPDMSDAYDPALRTLIKSVASEKGTLLREGVYMQLPGPQYETPAEIRMCRALGADAVGMSTAIETIAARHMGMKVCAVSCIANMAAGVTNAVLSHSEVEKNAAFAYPALGEIIEAYIKLL